TNSTNFSGTKDAANQDVKKDVSSLRYIALPNWIYEVHLESSSSQPQDACNTDEPESSGNSNPTATSTNPLADQLETLTVETPIPTVSSPVPTACLNNSPEPSSDTRLISKRVTNQEETLSLDNILTLSNRFEDILGVTTNSIDSDGVEADNVWTLVDCPKGVRPIETKWVLKNKKYERGFVIRNKARLVAQGHTQEEKIDYNEVFAHVARIEAIRLFLACASFMGFIVYQMDVKSAFLYGTIDEEVEFEAFMHEKFQMSAMSELNFFLGLQVLQKEDGIFLSQDKYVGDILKKFGYSDVRSANTPMDKENHWGKDGTRKDVDLHLYRSMIGSLMYLTASRPDIMFVVCACARHQVTPKKCHLHAVKRIFRYLKSHPKLELWYLKESPFDFVAYSDSNYGGATQDRKSTTGGCQFLGRRLISWQCKKQTIVATSTTEAEYVAAASGCGQVLRNLKLNDEAGISSLPDAELFENLTLMGYTISPNQKFTFQKGQFSHQWKYLIHTIMHCLSPKSNGFNEFSSNITTALGEGSRTPTEPHHTTSPEAQQTSPTTHSSPSLPPDTTATISPDRANITKTSTLTSDSTPRVTSLVADEGSMQQKLDELTDLYTSLQRQQTELVSKFEAQGLEINRLKAKVKLLEDRKGGGIAQSRDDAPIKGRSLDEGEEAAEKGSNDTEEMINVLTSLDAATVLSSRVAGVPTGSDVVPVASLIFTTATVVTPYTRRKGKEKMVETDTPKKKKLQEQIDVQVARELEEEMARDVQRMIGQIARDAEVARIHVKEELQMMINSLDRSNEYTQQRKPWSKKQKRDYYMAVIKSNLGWKTKDFKGMSFEDIEAKFTAIWKQIEDFIPIGSKEESKRFKRKGIIFEQESVKKMKTSEERSYWKITRLGGSTTSYQFLVDMLKHLDRDDLNQLWALVKESLSIRPASSDNEMELWVELKRLYEPDAEDQLWTHTQNMMHAPVEWKLYDMCGVHHVTFKDKEIFMLVEKDYPLRKALALLMICYKLQVENYSKMANDLVLKIHNIASSPMKISHCQKKFSLLVKKVPPAEEKQCHCCKDCTATKVKKSPWQDVILAIHSLQSKGINLMDFIQKKVGNGENTSFKDDSWLGEIALKVLYKRMPRGGVEQKNYYLLCSKVTDLVLPNISDRWCWSLECSQEFLVKSFCILIDNTILPKAKVLSRWLRVVHIKELDDVDFNSYNEWLNWIVNIRLHKQLKVFLEGARS
nr:uncharacterized mitochondrial protein AtMg00810-like [Tanacetum cinerariifolium]